MSKPCVYYARSGCFHPGSWVVDIGGVVPAAGFRVWQDAIEFALALRWRQEV